MVDTDRSPTSFHFRHPFQKVKAAVISIKTEVDVPSKKSSMQMDLPGFYGRRSHTGEFI